MSKIAPFLWYEKDAEQAARFYVSLLPDSSFRSVTTMPADSPSGPEGSVQVVDFIREERSAKRTKWSGGPF